MTQKFHKGDLVHVAADLGPSMRHFTADIDAIVIGSYKDQYGGGEWNEKQYTLHLKGRGESSWYYENQLELIEVAREDLLAVWQAKQVAEVKEKSDLDWIFANGPEVAKAPPGCSVESLAKHLGITNMWGSNGEGINWYCNAMAVLEIAGPFLLTKDKAGFLAFTRKSA